MPDPTDKPNLDLLAERPSTSAEGHQQAPERFARPPRPKEIGGPEGPEPTRYGDWERNGRCTDF